MGAFLYRFNRYNTRLFVDCVLHLLLSVVRPHVVNEADRPGPPRNRVCIHRLSRLTDLDEVWLVSVFRRLRWRLRPCLSRSITSDPAGTRLDSTNRLALEGDAVRNAPVTEQIAR